MVPKRLQQLKLGVIPTGRYGFGNVTATGEAKERVLTFLAEQRVNSCNLEQVTSNGLLDSPEQVEAVVNHLKLAAVDALFIPHCNFGCEEAVAHVARALGKPVLLWGEQDDALGRTDWKLVTDRQCGLFATSKVLFHFGVPFTYIVNCPINTPGFASAFENFLRVVNVVKAFQNLRIGQVDTRPSPFLTMMANETQLLETFGIRIVPTSLAHIIADARELQGTDEHQAEVASLQKKIPIWDPNAENTAKIAALKLALGNWAAANRCQALVVQCWTALQRTYGISTCFVNAELTEAGLPVGCESDVHGAITAVMLEAASANTTPSFFADLTVRHPTNQNAELLWHCGPFPYTLSDPASRRQVDDRGRASWRIRGGDMTLARFDGGFGRYSLLMGKARGVEGPETFGTYVWAEVNDWPTWERTLIEGPCAHHIVGIHDDVVPVLQEAVKYLQPLSASQLP